MKKLKEKIKFKSLLAIIYMVILLACATVFYETYSEFVTDTHIWDGETGTSYANGDGTQGNPYLISSGKELAYFRDMVNNGSTYAGSYFQLANDIDLSGRNWDPIGTYANSFRGVFDGAGHTISNIAISTASTLPSSDITSYGFFASLGGGSSYAIVKNVVFDNITVTVNYNGNTSTNTSTAKGFHIGTVVGTMFAHSNVSNVIVNNSQITQNSEISMRSYAFQYFVGGLAGYAVNSSTSNADPGTNARYIIDNCAVETNISTNTSVQYSWRTGYRYYNYAQHAIGGIIGGIRGQAVYPTNSLYKGSINASAFIGPIFGTVRGSNTNPSNSTTNFTTIYAGNDAGTVTNSSYYTDYYVNDTSFSSTDTIGNSIMENVEGVNKGTYITSAQNNLTNFNNNSLDGFVWYYGNNDLQIHSRLTGTIDENPTATFNLTINDYYNAGTYTSTWYVDGVETAATNNSLTISPQIGKDKVVRIVTYDGTYYGVTSFTIPKLELHFEFTYDATNHTLTATYAGNALPYVNVDDFSETWTYDDISGYDHETIATDTLTISTVGYDDGADFTITTTNGEYTFSSSYSIGNRIVVYVDYYNGSDYNTCLTPNDPCETMAGSYEKLSSTNSRANNVIVVMNNYNSGSYFNSANNSTYAKQATITTVYKKTNYSGVLYFEGGSNYKFLNASTTFQYITLTGSTGYQTNQVYFYLQGYDLTMGEGVTMTNYATSNTNQGLITGNAPAFHIFGGWLQYNYSTLPRTNQKILIKSGTYGRIIMGGSNGTATTSTMRQTTSHNFMGSSMSDMYQSELTIDIKNSTTPSTYTYDINLVVGGSAWGNMYANVTENIENGNVGRVLGASIGDSSYSLSNWNYPLNTFIGYSTININGGTIQELYGGALGRNMMALQGSSTEQCDSYFYGTVNININGGTVNGNIYGAGAGGVSGYSSASSDPYKSYGQNLDTVVNIHVQNGIVNGNIYGGGYGYTEYLTYDTIAPDGGTLYGKSNITIDGGTIRGNVYGAGKGYTSFSGRTALAQMNGNSTITLGGTAQITGKIYGAGEGAANYNDNAKMTGNPTINIGQDISTDIFGGGNIALLSGNPSINVNSGTITGVIYGGGNVGNVTGTSNIYINGGTSSDIYGGGYSANIDYTNISLEGGTVANIYGGSNTSGNVQKSTIVTTSGTAGNIYGGNNQGGNTTNTELTINGGTITAIYGGGNQTSTTSSILHLKKSDNKVSNIFGGGNAAAVDTTNIYIEGITGGNIYGGSNSSGDVTSSTININSGTSDYVYGGNNVGGVTSTSYIYANGGTIQYLFGGGKSTNLTTSNITLEGSTVLYTFGGSNTTGTVTESNIISQGGTLTDIYGGNNEGGTTLTSHITFTGANISGAIYGGGYSAPTGTTNVTINSTWNNLSFVYGGGKSADATTTNVIINGGNVNYGFGGSNTSGTIGTSNITTNNGYISYVYGGNNQGGTTTSSNVKIVSGTIEYVYGGNNAGGETTTSNVLITGGNVTNAYGGGNAAITGTTSITVNGATINSVVYGGGNAAGVTNNTDVNIINASIIGNAFGGGNAGSIGIGTDVLISNSTITDSVYAGGNGATAVVYGSTLLNIEKATHIANNVFGGGNAAPTGTADTTGGSSTINIVGAHVGKNVYGGANTSVVYGATYVNIGTAAVNNAGLTQDDIVIGGTVFGGGEANASGSENYDFSFISVTGGTNILIDGSGYTNFEINGSIFGSGNASSSTGSRIITIKNYGTFSNYKTNVSIQRATVVTVSNSAILLTGATDRTNEFSNVLFSISRVDHLKLMDNSTIFFRNGLNLVKKLSSLYDDSGTERKSTVTINTDNNTTTKTVNNRIYAYEGINLNIATDEMNTSFGEVSGMTFFGLFNFNHNNKIETAMYNNSYENNTTFNSGDSYYFTSGSYVLGMHKANHDITVDGFYSNYKDADDETKLVQNYISPTPDNARYYMWFIGEKVESYNVSLTASKFSTLGTTELPFLNFSDPNTTFSIVGFNYNDLEDGISLVDSSTIPRIAASESDANSKFGLTIKSGTTGWSNNGSTNFYSNNTTPISGTIDYNHENSTSVPSLVFYLYHSKNISTTGSMGTVVISLIAITPIDELNNKVQRININVTLNRALYSTNEYEGTITPGKQYELFASSAVNITSKSTFSAYYSLYAQSTTNIYRTGYHHSLVSTYVLPENTKITMVNYADEDNPEYYYYIVSAADYTAALTEYNSYGEASYNLAKFTKMGSLDSTNNYNEETHNAIYYDENTGAAMEEFVFMLDFAEANVTSDVSATLTFELRDANDQTIINVLGAIINSLSYHLYYNKDASIDVTADLSKNTIYGGETTNLNVTTTFSQQVIDTNTIVDTKYTDQKLGLKITLYDSNNNILNGTSLLGVSYTYKGMVYYPSIDGSTRLNIADRVSNVSSKIIIKINENTLASGTYKIKIESFGSPDGIYYGLYPSDSAEVSINVVDLIYGLKVETDDANIVINHTTGQNIDNVNTLKYVVYYSSGLTNPSITMNLERRLYDDIYSLDYELVNLQDYVTNSLTATSFTNEYLLTDNPDVSMSEFLYLKENLKTGTYRLNFNLYDGRTKIGSVYKYIIIK